MNTLTRIAIAAALLSLPACGGDTTKTETKVTKTVTKTVTPPPATDVKPEVKPEVAVTKPEPTTDKGPPAADSPEGKVQLAATVAREISGAPDRADEILGKHGLDRDKLDTLMFEIAGDPELTRAYMAARRNS
jgi:hypothetical protein